jgi:MATE family multidrug resistance protein
MIINVFFNWLLIAGNLGAPALGVEGAALASVIASWIGFGFLMWIFLRKRYVPGTIRGKLVLRRREMWRMIRFGAPNGFSWFLEFAAFALFINLVVGYLGTTPLAAMMVVMSINSVSFMPAFGLTSSGAILAGQAIGAGDLDDVPRIVRRTAGVTALWQGSVGVMYLLIPGVLIGLFTPPNQSTGELLATGTTILAMSAAWQLFDSVAMTLSEALRAAGDTTWSLWVRLGMAWFLFMPLSVLSVIVWEGEHVAAVACIIVYVAVLSVVLLWRFRSNRWREMDLTGDEPVLV